MRSGGSRPSPSWEFHHGIGTEVVPGAWRTTSHRLWQGAAARGTQRAIGSDDAPLRGARKAKRLQGSGRNGHPWPYGPRAAVRAARPPTPLRLPVRRLYEPMARCAPRSPLPLGRKGRGAGDWYRLGASALTTKLRPFSTRAGRAGLDGLIKEKRRKAIRRLGSIRQDGESRGVRTGCPVVPTPPSLRAWRAPRSGAPTEPVPPGTARPPR